jgi:hypothetical protein
MAKTVWTIEALRARYRKARNYGCKNLNITKADFDARVLSLCHHEGNISPTPYQLTRMADEFSKGNHIYNSLKRMGF